MIDINLIVACSRNKVIGIENKLPWHLPSDLKRFKEFTTGNTIIMGRKTYDSIGKALPNRKNIVISRNPNLKLNDAEVVTSIEDALKFSENKVFIIGGEQIYLYAMPFANKILMTLIHDDIEGDAFFPAIDEVEWVINERSEVYEENGIRYSYLTYLKS